MPQVLMLNADMQPMSYLPISTSSWKDAIRLKYKGVIEVVHEYDWEVRSPSVVWKLPSVVMVKKYAKPNIKVRYSDYNVALRDNFQCQYCNVSLAFSAIEMEHVMPASKGGRRTWTNIVASCGPCNRKKGNDERIVPAVRPRKPDYWELVSKAKQHKITIPDKSWIPYIGWDESLINITPTKIDMEEVVRLLSEDNDETIFSTNDKQSRKSA